LPVIKDFFLSFFFIHQIITPTTIKINPKVTTIAIMVECWISVIPEIREVCGSGVGVGFGRGIGIISGIGAGIPGIGIIPGIRAGIPGFGGISGIGTGIPGFGGISGGGVDVGTEHV